MAKKTKAATPVAEVEVVDKGGLGIDEGIVLATFLLLAGAITLVIMVSKTYEIVGSAG